VFFWCGLLEGQLADPSKAQQYSRQLSALQAAVPQEQQLQLSELRQVVLQRRIGTASLLEPHTTSRGSSHPQLALLAAAGQSLGLPAAACAPLPYERLVEATIAADRQLRALDPHRPYYANELSKLLLSPGLHNRGRPIHSTFSASKAEALAALALAERSRRPSWVCSCALTLLILANLPRVPGGPPVQLGPAEVEELKRKARLGLYASVVSAGPASVGPASSASSAH